MKRALTLAGALLCIAAIAFFGVRIAEAGVGVPAAGWRRAALPLAAAAVAYAAAVVLLSLQWSLLVAGRIRSAVVASYMVAQFGKYIPGNVFQFVGRHALGRELGIAHAVLARAALYEIAFLVSAAGVVAGLFVDVVPQGLEWLRPLLAAGGAAGLAAMLALPRLGSHPLLLPMPPHLWARLVVGYLAFFAAFGLLYVGCLALFGVAAGFGAPTGAAALGWILGFVVPGAPAGAGLREATMALVPTGTPAQAAAVLGAIVAFRVVTMGGDFIAFLSGLWLRHHGRNRGAGDRDTATPVAAAGPAPTGDASSRTP